MVCPHAVIRIKVYDSTELNDAPATFESCEARDGVGGRGPDSRSLRKTAQLSDLRSMFAREEQECSAAEGYEYGAAAYVARPRRTGNSS